MNAQGRKAEHHNIASYAAIRLVGGHRASTGALLFYLLVSAVSALPALADDFEWSGGTADNENSWQTASNWNPSKKGDEWSPADTAIFGGSANSTSPTLSIRIEIGSIIFEPGASQFSIRPNGQQLTLRHAGIINQSGIAQTIDNSAGNSIRPSIVLFQGGDGWTPNAADTMITNSGPNSQANFIDAAAGNARIVNSGPGAGNSFLGSASAENATIINSGPGSSSQFAGTATAANAELTNEGVESDVNFSVSGRAGSARITNSGPGSFTAFRGNALGQQAVLINADPEAFITIEEIDADGTSFASIAGEGRIYLGSKNLTVGDNQGTTFSGVISDGQAPNLPNSHKDQIRPGVYLPEPSYTGGSLTKVGTGTLTLTGENTYPGGTTITQGTLQLGNGGTSGSVAGSILNNGILAFNRSDTFTFPVLIAGTTEFEGIISGTGSVQQNGTGTTVFVQNNTYTGGTIINAGTLQLGNGGTSGSVVGNITNNGILAFNRSDTLTLGGIISGTGSVLQRGSGTTVLAGNNTYSGGTTLAAGSILTQSSSALGSGPVTFGNGTTLQVQNLLNVNGDWTVLPGIATVSGGLVRTLGDFSINGGGTLIANANFDVPGSASVNSSQLVVNNRFLVGRELDLNGDSEAVINGALTSPLVNVNDASSLIVNSPGSVAGNVSVAQSAHLALFGAIKGNVTNAGFFGGTGVVNGNVLNSGVVAPGTSIGRLTINGNYTQNRSGTLSIEVAGRSPGQYDLVVVNGRASLAGRLQLIRVGGFKLRVGDRITFLTASGGVSGSFNTVENDFDTGTILDGEAVFLPNSLVLELTQGSFAEFAVTPNERAVGMALDSAVGDSRASELLEFLNNEPLETLRNDLNLISPDELSSIYVVAVSLANVQSSNLERRMSDIRAGSNGFSSAGFAISGSRPTFQGLQDGFSGVSGPEGKSGPSMFVPTPENRWGAFATGVGEFTNVDSTFNASGYDLETGGFTVGLDYRIGSHFAIGLMGGYAYTGVNGASDGKLRVNGGKLGVYATAFGSGFYLDGAVNGGLNGYDTRRTALVGSADGSTVGGELNVLVAGGYDWKIGGFTIGPTASFQYTYVGFDDFSEDGSLAPLQYPDQHSYSARTAFGMKASYDWKLGPVRLVPEIRAAWQHEYGVAEYPIIASLANGAGNSFTVTGPEIGRDSLLLSAGFAVQWNDRISSYIYYDGELFRTNYLSNNVSAGVRIAF